MTDFSNKQATSQKGAKEGEKQFYSTSYCKGEVKHYISLSHQTSGKSSLMQSLLVEKMGIRDA